MEWRLDLLSCAPRKKRERNARAKQSVYLHASFSVVGNAVRVIYRLAISVLWVSRVPSRMTLGQSLVEPDATLLVEFTVTRYEKP